MLRIIAGLLIAMPSFIAGLAYAQHSETFAPSADSTNFQEKLAFDLCCSTENRRTVGTDIITQFSSTYDQGRSLELRQWTDNPGLLSWVGPTSMQQPSRSLQEIDHFGERIDFGMELGTLEERRTALQDKLRGYRPDLSAEDLAEVTPEMVNTDPMNLGIEGVFSFPGDDLMTGGVGSNPTQIQQIQDLLKQSSMPSSLVANSGNLSSSNCSTMTSSLRDACYMPSVGLVQRPRADDAEVYVDCSGVLIGQRHLVTAAHCVCDPPEAVVLGTGMLGSLSLYSLLDQTSVALQTRLVEQYASGLVRVVAQPILLNDKNQQNYCDTRLVDDDNIAIITLSVAVNPGGNGPAVVLAVDPREGRAELAGFGPDPRTNGPAAKRYLSAQFRPGDIGKFNVETAMGASCGGDSGSGLHQRLSDGRLGLIGILSRGRNLYDNCGSTGEEGAVYLDLSTPERKEFLIEHVPDITWQGPNAQLAIDHMTTCLAAACPD